MIITDLYISLLWMCSYLCHTSLIRSSHLLRSAPYQFIYVHLSLLVTHYKTVLQPLTKSKCLGKTNSLRQERGSEWRRVIMEASLSLSFFSLLCIFIVSFSLSSNFILQVRGDDPYRFFTWVITYGDIYPLGVKQQV